VLVTGYATVESAVAALKEGAYDYVQKPFRHRQAAHRGGEGARYYQLATENLRLRHQRRAFEEAARSLASRKPRNGSTA